MTQVIDYGVGPRPIIRACRLLTREEALAFVRADARRHGGRPADLVEVSREQLRLLTDPATNDFSITDPCVTVRAVSLYDCPTLQLIRTP
jgi:hypothetical protein